MLILVYELKGENLSLRSEGICSCQKKKEKRKSAKRPFMLNLMESLKVGQRYIPVVSEVHC